MDNDTLASGQQLEEEEEEATECKRWTGFLSTFGTYELLAGQQRVIAAIRAICPTDLPIGPVQWRGTVAVIAVQFEVVPFWLAVDKGDSTRIKCSVNDWWRWWWT